jgi:hypothetical protein
MSAKARENSVVRPRLFVEPRRGIDHSSDHREVEPRGRPGVTIHHVTHIHSGSVFERFKICADAPFIQRRHSPARRQDRGKCIGARGGVVQREHREQAVADEFQDLVAVLLQRS